MSDLISKLEAVAAISKEIDKCCYPCPLGMQYGMGLAIDIIRSVPSADPVIVRCKDCKHWSEKGHGYREPWECSHWCAETEPDDYCSYGERKSDG